MDDDWLTLSALEHFAYCPWQARLLQDGVWADNHLTVQGTSAHEHVDVPGVDSRRGIRVHRRVSVSSSSLRVYGVADAVEESRSGVVMPVEHKWGRGAGDLTPSFVQVTAQALCLSEMLGIEVPIVAVYIVAERRRETAATTDWRDLTLEVIMRARHDLLGEHRPSRPKYVDRLCRRCSLLESCAPDRGVM